MSTNNSTIVGGGLVGSLLACYLAKRGHQVDVYESRPDMRKAGYIGGRSINLALSVRGWTALEKIGLKGEIEKISIPMYGRMIHSVSGEKNFQQYGKEDEAIYSVSRGELNKRLVELADSYENVTFHFNELCEKVNFQDTSIDFFNFDRKEKHQVKADKIFGTDGAFSRVRSAFMALPRFNYSQNYIEHGYKELHIPANAQGEHQLEKNALHIWPRGSFMMIALPNIDGSFTCTMFVPFEGEDAFDDLATEKNVVDFFEKYFPDAIPLMPNYIEDFFRNPTSGLVTVRCNQWYQNNVCLLGDASHAIVPFFGQGMNAGFEDVRILDELMDAQNEQWSKVFPQFNMLRKPDTDAIAQMALDNFIEMRDLVADEHFLNKKRVEKLIMADESNQYLSLYSGVSFSNERYSEVYKKGLKQNELLEELVLIDDVDLKIKSEEIKKKIRQKINGG
ncbi:MAG: FAD-dependent monooxygenase [Bacteroidetes bacterium]|nr:FAD-dependent monooxygenase [Bacteroidota bacterium]